MKKTLGLLILLLIPFRVFCADLDISITQGEMTKTTALLLSSDEVKIGLTLHQDENGLLSCAVGRSYVFDNGKVTCGEIRMGETSLFHVNTPSKSPSFMGIGFFSDNADLAILTRPVGTALFFRGKRVRLGLLFHDSSTVTEEDELAWQMNWKNDINKGKTLRTSLFLRSESCTYSSHCVVNTMTGFDYSDELTVRLENFSFERKRHDEEEMKLTLILEDDEMRHTVSYLRSMGRNPVYGGKSTHALFVFSQKTETGPFSFTSSSRVEYKEDTQVIRSTDFSLSNGKMTFSLVFERTDGVRNGFRSPSFNIKTESLSLLIGKGKAHVDISKTIRGERLSFGLHITEKRLYSIFIRCGI